MSQNYSAVQWNRQKRIYDAVLVGIVFTFLVTFVAVTKSLYPRVTDEILLIRGFGIAAFLLLHIILCVGPLCRLDRRFLPLLYNRRHAGVTCFLLGMIHAALVILTYHVGGDVNPFVSIFTSTPLRASVDSVPFQAFGFVALFILFLMAATSHDFWLSNLTAPVWKTLHMLVYAAYTLLIAHVVFGILQSETHSLPSFATVVGAIAVIGLHFMAGFREAKADDPMDQHSDVVFVDACSVDEIPEKRARVVHLSGERVAIFKYDGKISAVSNVCQHQNGPLGEGKIVFGCVTCPWHGYQYEPATGASPPPFVEKIPTFHVRVRKGRVLINPQPLAPGTHVEPAVFDRIPTSGTIAHEE